MLVKLISLNIGTESSTHVTTQDNRPCIHTVHSIMGLGTKSIDTMSLAARCCGEAGEHVPTHPQLHRVKTMASCAIRLSGPRTASVGHSSCFSAETPLLV